MICFFVKTKATDDTRSISSPFTRSPLSFRVSFPLFSPPFLPSPIPKEGSLARAKQMARIFSSRWRVSRERNESVGNYSPPLFWRPSRSRVATGGGGLKANRRRFRFNDRYGTV